MFRPEMAIIRFHQSGFYKLVWVVLMITSTDGWWKGSSERQSRWWKRAQNKRWGKQMELVKGKQFFSRTPPQTG